MVRPRSTEVRGSAVAAEAEIQVLPGRDARGLYESILFFCQLAFLGQLRSVGKSESVMAAISSQHAKAVIAVQSSRERMPSWSQCTKVRELGFDARNSL